MTDYIRKQDVSDWLKQYGQDVLHGKYKFNLMYIWKNIMDLPSADVVPVRHGTWLPIVSYNNTYKCSECGRLLVDITDGLKMVAKNYPYCHCGAKMDAQGEET